MLSINSIDVFYGDAQALWDITIDISKGEMVTLIGANGAGKSTTLKTIAGLLRPKKGSIEFFGDRLDTLPVNKICERGISYVPEGRRLFSSLTVLENIRMGAYTKGARQRFDDSLERVLQLFPILKERKNQLAGRLSGGEQQMLAIARGLISNPQLLLLDEASLGLAPKVLDQIYGAIHALHEQGITILFVEQNVQLALTAAQRAYVLENGKIVLSGKSEELLKNESVKDAYIGIW